MDKPTKPLSHLKLGNIAKEGGGGKILRIRRFREIAIKLCLLVYQKLHC